MKILLMFLLVVTGQFAFAESKSSIDFALSGGQLNTAAISYNRLYDVGFLGGLRFGWVARVTHANKSDAKYETAPGSIRTGKSDWLSGATGTEIPENIDTLRVEDTEATFAGLGYIIEYQATSKFKLGHSLDVIGFTFGPDSDVTYTPNPTRGSATAETQTRAKLAGTNLFLLGNNDIGSLNSEFFVSYDMNEDYSVRAGLAYTFVEYKTEQKFDFDNDRFRIKATGLLLGFNYRL